MRSACPSRPRPAPRGGTGACVPSGFRRPSGGSDCLPWPSVHPRSPPVSLSLVATRPFPSPQGSDTIPIAGRPPVCVRHAQAGRFSSTRFTRRARPSGRWAVLRGARRIKAYSFGPIEPRRRDIPLDRRFPVATINHADRVRPEVRMLATLRSMAFRWGWHTSSTGMARWCGLTIGSSTASCG